MSPWESISWGSWGIKVLLEPYFIVLAQSPSLALLMVFYFHYVGHFSLSQIYTSSWDRKLQRRGAKMGFLAWQPKVAYKTARASFAWDTLEKNHPATSAARHFIFTLTLDLMCPSASTWCLIQGEVLMTWRRNWVTMSKGNIPSPQQVVCPGIALILLIEFAYCYLSSRNKTTDCYSYEYVKSITHSNLEREITEVHSKPK